jgi:hypothetical protein
VHADLPADGRPAPDCVTPGVHRHRKDRPGQFRGNGGDPLEAGQRPDRLVAALPHFRKRHGFDGPQIARAEFREPGTGPFRLHPPALHELVDSLL